MAIWGTTKIMFLAVVVLRSSIVGIGFLLSARPVSSGGSRSRAWFSAHVEFGALFRCSFLPRQDRERRDISQSMGTCWVGLDSWTATGEH